MRGAFLLNWGISWILLQVTPKSAHELVLWSQKQFVRLSVWPLMLTKTDQRANKKETLNAIELLKVSICPPILLSIFHPNWCSTLLESKPLARSSAIWKEPRTVCPIDGHNINENVTTNCVALHYVGCEFSVECIFYRNVLVLAIKRCKWMYYGS